MSLLVGETSQVFQTPGRPDFQLKAAVHKESNQFRMTLLGFLGNGGREIPRLNYNDRFGGEASIEPKMAVQWWRGGCRNCTVQRNHEEEALFLFSFSVEVTSNLWVSRNMCWLHGHNAVKAANHILLDVFRIHNSGVEYHSSNQLARKNNPQTS